MLDQYILEGHKAVPCDDILKYGNWFKEANKRVAKTEIGIPAWKFWLGKLLKIKRWEPVKILTVFLGLDYRFGDGDPLLFETMIFGGELDEEQQRYTTWGQAEAGHKKWVEKVKKTKG